MCVCGGGGAAYFRGCVNQCSYLEFIVVAEATKAENTYHQHPIEWGEVATHKFLLTREKEPSKYSFFCDRDEHPIGIGEAIIFTLYS